MCHNIGHEHEGEVTKKNPISCHPLSCQVVCHPPVSMTEAVSSGTYCLHTCHGHPKVNCKAINYKGLQSGPHEMDDFQKRTEQQTPPPGSESQLLTAKHPEFCSWSELETATRSNVRSFVSAYFTTQWQKYHTTACKKTMHHSKQLYSPLVLPHQCVQSHNAPYETGSREVLLCKRSAQLDSTLPLD